MRPPSCVRFLCEAVACDELGVRHIKTRPYTPRTNGKAERLVQTSLGEWAYVRPYERSAQLSATQRNAALQPFIDGYNRTHSPTLRTQPHASHQPYPGCNDVLRLNN